MARGDQIYVMRQLAGIPGFYEHHGIDCGNGMVIHYSKVGSEPEIRCTTYESFARGNSVYHKPQALTFVSEVVVRRAESRLGERKYDLFFNNCEHFANWCANDRSESQQLAVLGLRPDWLKRPELKALIQRTAQERSPQSAIAVFRQALGDIAVAYDGLRRQQQNAQEDVDAWRRVALMALERQREDLARAALHRKINAQKRLQTLTNQLEDLIELRLDLERNRDRAQQSLNL